SVFYAAFLWRPALRMLRESRLILALTALAGAVAAVIPETTWDKDEGRFSGLWNIARRLPVIADHTSPLIVTLAALGAAALAVWSRVLPPRDRWIFLAALAAFAA